MSDRAGCVQIVTDSHSLRLPPVMGLTSVQLRPHSHSDCAVAPTVNADRVPIPILPRLLTVSIICRNHRSGCSTRFHKIHPVKAVYYSGHV
jgi:hypothetical protein